MGNGSKERDQTGKSMKKRNAIIVFVVVLLAAGEIGAYMRLRDGRNTLPAQYYASHNVYLTTSPPRLDHVVIIVEENKTLGSIIGNPNAPYLNRLARTYSLADNYFAVTNPSLPNYLALTSGTTNGISSDCYPTGTSCQVTSTNIADQLEQAGKTWKEYANSMPHPCDVVNSGEYAVRHIPFLYYPDITSNKSRCLSHVVPYSQFLKDLTSSTTLPDYSFITPNLCNDMHSCSIQIGDDWLAQQVPTILDSSPFTQQHSLLVVVWDEGDALSNNVAVIFAGSDAEKGYISHSFYSHYSLLHTIEWMWSMKPLTRDDTSAPIMNDMLQLS